MLIHLSMAGILASGVIPPAPPHRTRRGGGASQAAGPAAGVARGGHGHFPGSNTTSTR
jgi:hypothetical protein